MVSLNSITSSTSGSCNLFSGRKNAIVVTTSATVLPAIPYLVINAATLVLVTVSHFISERRCDISINHPDRIRDLRRSQTSHLAPVQPQRSSRLVRERRTFQRPRRCSHSELFCSQHRRQLCSLKRSSKRNQCGLSCQLFSRFKHQRSSH